MTSTTTAGAPSADGVPATDPSVPGTESGSGDAFDLDALPTPRAPPGRCSPRCCGRSAPGSW